MRVDLSYLRDYSSPRKSSINHLSELANLIFDLCSGCLKLEIMSAIPQSAFAACKIRSNMEKSCHASWQVSMMKADEEEKKQEKPNSSPNYHRVNQAVLESPMKYNSKLMNSIWGLYNRYSVHNFKKNNDAKDFSVFQGHHHL